MAVRKTAASAAAAPPAKSASKQATTPAARAPAKKAAAKQAEPDLLSGMNDDSPASTKDDDDEVFDMLDNLSEDNGTPWLPADKDDPSPAGIQGRVLFRGTVPSDFGPEDVPILEVQTADEEVWAVRGYATVLRNQINKADPSVGDLIALKYFGVKASKNGKDYGNYKVAVKHAA